MPTATKLVRDDEYEELGMAYQCVLIATIDAALVANGVAKKVTRRKVCEAVLFELGDFHDQGWFKVNTDATPAYPLLWFSRRFLNTDTPVGRLGPVLAPSESFAFHEYAHGCVEAFYDGDPAAQIETGSVGDESEK